MGEGSGAARGGDAGAGRDARAVAVENLPRTAGDVLGVMQWTCARSGRVRRWVVRIGDRADRITVEAPGEQPTRSHGWAWFLAMLRRKILRGG